jgi:hypothetical protein
VGAPATTLSLLSAMFGMFYMAIIVSLFVGMAQSQRSNAPTQRSLVAMPNPGGATQGRAPGAGVGAAVRGDGPESRQSPVHWVGVR